MIRKTQEDLVRDAKNDLREDIERSRLWNHVDREDMLVILLELATELANEKE